MVPTILCLWKVSQQAPALKLANESTSHKVWALFKMLGPGLLSVGTSPLRTISQFATAHSSCGGDSHWFSKLAVLRAHLWGAGLKSWVSVEKEPFAPRGKVSNLDCCARWGVYGEITSTYSTCFYEAFFLFALCEEVILPALRGGGSQKTAPRAVMDLLCLWEEASSGPSYLTMFSRNLRYVLVVLFQF